ncbi:NERD domain-containing protein [Anaerofilum sp. BX8]|uniref:NERD domain-containing protein n=1 Tax=Anaerofilum hominis TaxID=2763016 RepID=A0A923L206_9FIRM|nr:nuclease-related domain-containing protein [Anaerofilum hominis]MBC5582386.1 NERD domain-containing protein [Anaerofilum hominis]
MTTNALLNILGLVAVLAVVFLIIYFISKSKSEEGPTNTAKRAQKDRGVDAAVKALNRYASLHNFRILQPAHLHWGEKSAELDAIIVTFSGIVGVRCLGYNGEIFANSGEPDWLWVTQESRTRIPDPVAQCAADARVIRDVLMQNPKLRNVPVECLPVFTDKSVQLAVPKSSRIFRQKDLMSTLEKEKYLEDKGLDQETIATLLSDALQG